MTRAGPGVALAVALLGGPLAAEDFTFDLAAYRKPPTELGGHLELGGEVQDLDPGAALAPLEDPAAGALRRARAVAELEGLARVSGASVHGRLQLAVRDDQRETRRDAVVQEAYGAWHPRGGWSLEVGKRVFRWGPGYAWNPVGFVERPKDPNDPDLSREGFWAAAAESLRTFDGPLQTLAFTTLVVPVDGDLNGDFATREGLNGAVRIYGLYRDTDLHLTLLTGSGRGDRVGLDVSRNLAPNLEVHGELGWVDDQVRFVLDGERLVADTRDRVSALLGIRWLSTNEVTWIAEYYRRGDGYSPRELTDFYRLSRGDSPRERALAAAARGAGYGERNPGRDYLYLRASRKDLLGVVYLDGAVTTLVNLGDGSGSVTPELTYTGWRDSEVRLRLGWLGGGRDTEFGERPAERRVELRLRYFF